MKPKKLLPAVAYATLGSLITLLIVWKFTPRPPDAPSIFYEPSPAELALDKIIEEVDFKDATLDEVAKELTEKAGIIVEADWDQLARDSIDRDLKLTFKARHASLEKILNNVTDSYIAVDSGSDIDYFVEHDRICFTSAVYVYSQTTIRAYDVSDLLNKGVVGKPEEISRLIKEFVVHEASDGTGGSSGSIYVFADRLLINQTDVNHRKIRQALHTLRHPERAADPAKQKGTP